MKDIAKNRKYQAALSTGKKLFWKYGLKRVSIEEICKEASVSKMTFYKYFPNKIELAKSILKGIMEQAMEQFEELINSDLSFEQKVEQMMHMKMEGTKELSVEFLNDIYANPDNGLLAFMQKYSEQSTSIFAEFLKQAQHNDEIRKDVSIDFILYQMNLMTQTVNDQTLLAKYNSPGELIMENMRYLFYGMMPNK
ncbi:TetR/AcrR family transcriptional regulator [Carboxylicivirga sediminis]|uniref:TetR/AcrR family transcriptional regulator n=1 Tax=Carboxylicivirga sediminis TaxID=2006564 RepID=A0A941F713_9BACT|nr:TetR/AcrR family transcriptional regulator [Carboxylicivirga sediminis]MBR8537981.1 TetR/AcrR family transcriptional regulator [Carboxylicivirga sediminis]